MSEHNHRTFRIWGEPRPCRLQPSKWICDGNSSWKNSWGEKKMKLAWKQQEFLLINIWLASLGTDAVNRKFSISLWTVFFFLIGYNTYLACWDLLVHMSCTVRTVGDLFTLRGNPENDNYHIRRSYSRLHQADLATKKKKKIVEAIEKGERLSHYQIAPVTWTLAEYTLA